MRQEEDPTPDTAGGRPKCKGVESALMPCRLYCAQELWVLSGWGEGDWGVKKLLIMEKSPEIF